MVEFIQSSGTQGCSRSLVLLLDESYSINADNWKKQVHATADAISRPDIAELLSRNGGTAIAVASFNYQARQRLDWQVIRSQQDADAFADAFRHIGPKAGGATNIGRGLAVSLENIHRSPCKGEAIIDISTDAHNTAAAYVDGGEAIALLEAARAQAIAEGVVINGIGVDGQSQKGDAVRRMLEQKVITPTGFAMGTAWEDYAEAIYKKLRLELHSQLPEDPVVPDVPRKAAMLGGGMNMFGK